MHLSVASVGSAVGKIIWQSPDHNILLGPERSEGFNVMPRRIPDFPDYFNSWNSLSSIGSGITLISFFYLFLSFLL